MSHRPILVCAWVAVATACGGTIGDGLGTDGAAVDGGPGRADATPSPDGNNGCENPQFMIILDRSGSMSQKPDGTMPPNTLAGEMQTKWYLAVSAIQTVTQQLEQNINFGLSLFPKDDNGAGGFDCSNLNTWLAEYQPQLNPPIFPTETHDQKCQAAELMVSPTQGAAAAIAAQVPVDSTGLCLWTPIGSGLDAARSELAAIKDPKHPQFALLLTDGVDTCDGESGYGTISLPEMDSLHAAGVTTYVIGFDGSGTGVDPAELNDLACAGGSAPNLNGNCVLVGGGLRAVAAPSPARLFFLAESGQDIMTTLSDIGKSICCGCVE